MSPFHRPKRVWKINMENMEIDGGDSLSIWEIKEEQEDRECVSVVQESEE